MGLDEGANDGTSDKTDPLNGRLVAGAVLLGLALLLFVLVDPLFALLPAAIGLYQLVVAGIGFGVREGRRGGP